MRHYFSPNSHRHEIAADNRRIVDAPRNMRDTTASSDREHAGPARPQIEEEEAQFLHDHGERRSTPAKSDEHRAGRIELDVRVKDEREGKNRVHWRNKGRFDRGDPANRSECRIESLFPFD